MDLFRIVLYILCIYILPTLSVFQCGEFKQCRCVPSFKVILCSHRRLTKQPDFTGIVLRNYNRVDLRDNFIRKITGLKDFPTLMDLRGNPLTCDQTFPIWILQDSCNRASSALFPSTTTQHSEVLNRKIHKNTDPETKINPIDSKGNVGIGVDITKSDPTFYLWVTGSGVSILGFIITLALAYLKLKKICKHYEFACCECPKVKVLDGENTEDPNSSNSSSIPSSDVGKRNSYILLEENNSSSMNTPQTNLQGSQTPAQRTGLSQHLPRPTKPPPPPPPLHTHSAQVVAPGLLPAPPPPAPPPALPPAPPPPLGSTLQPQVAGGTSHYTPLTHDSIQTDIPDIEMM